MTNEVLGIISVFLCTGVLLIVRQLILIAGKGKSTPALTSRIHASKSNLRLVDIRSEDESGRPQVKTAMNP
ncbi:MAG: hypothetical protein ACJ74J_10880 [Blastocatellia bacterium]